MKAMAKKIFQDTLEERLSACSSAELRAILRAMAQAQPPAARRSFLDQLKPSGQTAAGIREAEEEDDLLAAIDDLAETIQAAQGDPDDWGESYWEHDDEDSLGSYEQFVEPLEDLFDQVATVFDYGNPVLARQAYLKLYETLQIQDDYGRGIGAEDLHNVNFSQTRARYLRSVYETEPVESRAQILFAQMQAVRSWYHGSRPMLKDLLKLSSKALPDQNTFLPAWIALLRKVETQPDVDAWLSEAVELSGGVKALEKLARNEGRKRPRVYVDWIKALQEDKQHRKVLAAAKEALQALPAGLPVRARIADQQGVAAAKLKDDKSLRAAQWEGFLAQPVLSRLLDVWETAPSTSEKTKRMRQAAMHVKEYLAHPPDDRMDIDRWERDEFESTAWVDQSVLAHAYLLARDWDAVHKLAAKQKVLGWSGGDNSQGLVVSFLLMHLSGKTPEAAPANLQQLWRWALSNNVGFFGSWQIEKEMENEIEDEYEDDDENDYDIEDEDNSEDDLNVFERAARAHRELLKVSLSQDKQKKHLAWCVDIAKKRVGEIVGNKHRRSYGKAASLICACAEVLELRNQTPKSRQLIKQMRDCFPRHRAFLAEMDTAQNRSDKQ